MFDSGRIIQDISGQIGHYFSRTLKTLLERDSLPQLALDEVSWQRAVEQNAELDNAIRLLVRVTNGDIPGDLADEIIMGEVEDSIETLLKTLFTSPGSPHHYAVPAPFWHTELGQVIQHCQRWLRGDDLISYTEAAAILWPDEAVQAARMRIKRMVERGDLTTYTDPTENNPQRAARVSREEVESFR